VCGILQSFGQTGNHTASSQIKIFNSNTEELPYWFTHNQRGRISDSTNVLVSTDYKFNYDTATKHNFSVGANAQYVNQAASKFQIDQLYINYSNRWLNATLGAKHPDIKYNGLSSSNGNILWSGNTRAIPGLLLKANTPIKITKAIALNWGLGHYELGDDRYAKGAKIHYKSLGAFIKFNKKSQLQLGIKHYVQWAGDTEAFGKAPSGVSDFIDIFFAKKAGDENAIDGEKVNALGNHLGLYDIKYSYKFKNSKIELYHQHLFEDGSGSAFKNFPDGIWGVNLTNKESWLSSILYEYVYTLNQSGSTGISGRDNYFSNSFYRTGWRYKNRVIGIPFITPNTIENGSGNNRVKAHHMGAKLKFNKLVIEVKGTILERLGTYSSPINPKQKSLYSYINGSYLISNKFLMSLSVGVDYNSYKKNVYSIGGALKYKIF
jgi:hypothetical protein